MSIKEANISMTREKSVKIRKLIADKRFIFVFAVVVALMFMLLSDATTARAQESDDSGAAVLATSTDANNNTGTNTDKNTTLGTITNNKPTTGTTTNQNTTTSTATKKKNGVVSAKVNGKTIYRYYKNGKLIKKKGWVKVSDTVIAYIDSKGYVTKRYYKSKKVLQIYKNGTLTRASNIVETLSDGYSYYFGKNGVMRTTKGWYTYSKNKKYNLSKKYRVIGEYVRSGDVIKIYKYNAKTKKFALCKNTWVTVGDDKYYMSSTGVCKTLYYKKQKKAYQLSGSKKLVMVKKDVVTLQGGNICYFNAKGVRVSKSGWYDTKSGGEVYVSKSGYVTSKVTKSNGRYRLYTKSKGKWSPVKNAWKCTSSRLYYTSSKGYATVVYNRDTKKLYKYSASTKSYTLMKNVISKLNGKLYYYYNGNGVRSTSTGWKKVDATTSYYVGKKGYVTQKYINKNGVRKLNVYNYSKNSWESKKDSWCNIGNSKIYFNAKGVGTVYYSTDTNKGYVYSNKKWTLIKKSIKKIGSSNYYFNAKGERETKAGVYKTSNGYLAYVNSKGTVYKREYDLSVKRYYTITLKNGKTTKVYGYYDLDAASSLLKEVNAHREDNGFSALKASTSLTETAATRALEISNTYSHYRPDGTLCLNSMYELYGENLACGFNSDKLVFRAWKKSTAHNNNMLNTSYKTMGAAVFIALKNDKEGFKRYYVLTFGK
jgi:uncharacterized protein YkwD